MTGVPTALVASGGTFWTPPQASSFAGDVDHVFYFILILCTIFFVGIMAAMVYFVVKYRRRSEGQRTSPLEGNRTIEIIWTAVPSVLLVIIYVWGTKVYLHEAVPPANAMEVRVNAQQWAWSFDYPAYGCAGASEMVVPQGKPVRLTITSQDVIHSFFVPAFRVKKDAVPNRYTVAWFQGDAPGDYDIYCTEYCGKDHSRMRATVKVVSPADFEEWAKGGCGTGGGSLSPIAYGKKLFQQKACSGCHSLEGKRLVGPPLNGLFGKKEPMQDGSTVVVDENYIRESLMDPKAKIVKGYPPVMPTFKGQLNDQQVNALVDFIKSLSKNK